MERMTNSAGILGCCGDSDFSQTTPEKKKKEKKTTDKSKRK